jgi:glycosyltransferase involved in cell wall biosynthesis
MSIPRKAIFLLYGRLFGIPVVLHHHGAEFIPEYEKRSGAYRRLVRWAVNAAQCNIVLGRLWEDFLSRDLGVPKDRIVLLYNAVSDPGRPAPRVEKPGPLRLLILANLSARKGVGELLQAMKALTGSGRDLTLTLAGGGEVDAFRARAEGLGIGKRCRFTGWIPATDAAKLWAETDLFVLPSHHEGLPMAILEALSQSVPVVATPVGSIPEVLTDGTDCRLMPPGDTAALTRTLASLQDDPGERRRLGEAGRLLFERQFALDQYIDRLLRLYGHLQPPELEGKRA